MKEAHFVSTFDFYDQEECGDKPYTIRDDTPLNRKKLRGATHITLHRGYTKKKFTREISNILFWKNRSIITAWRNRA